MKITMAMMDAAKQYLVTTGPLYRVEKPASVWLSQATRNANPGTPWQALPAMCQEALDHTATLMEVSK